MDSMAVIREIPLRARARHVENAEAIEKRDFGGYGSYRLLFVI